MINEIKGRLTFTIVISVYKSPTYSSNKAVETSINILQYIFVVISIKHKPVQNNDTGAFLSWEYKKTSNFSVIWIYLKYVNEINRFNSPKSFKLSTHITVHMHVATVNVDKVPKMKSSYKAYVK